jgi:[ribosomal protein S18]-alanine N-acetyltransferase
MATAAISLRHGDARDIAAVDALMAAAFDPRFGEAWTRNQCLGVLAMPAVRLTLAHLDDRPAGFSMVRTILDEAELLLLAVAPRDRRAGVGGALLRATLADGQMAGTRRMHLEVRSSNPAVRLYEANGFARIGVRQGYYRGRTGEAHDALTYARDL